MFKVNNIKNERHRFGVFIVNFEHITTFLVFLLWTFNKYLLAGYFLILAGCF